MSSDQVTEHESAGGSPHHRTRKHVKGGESPETTISPGHKTMNNTKNSTHKSVQKKVKPIKSPKAAEEHCDLESPTSVQMKQSFLLKQSDKEFESYWNLVKKKKEGHPAIA